MSSLTALSSPLSTVMSSLPLITTAVMIGVSLRCIRYVQSTSTLFAIAPSAKILKNRKLCFCYAVYKIEFHANTEVAVPRYRIHITERSVPADFAEIDFVSVQSKFQSIEVKCGRGLSGWFSLSKFHSLPIYMYFISSPIYIYPLYSSILRKIPLFPPPIYISRHLSM